MFKTWIIVLIFMLFAQSVFASKLVEIIDGRAVVKVRLPKELLEHLKLDDQQLVEPSKMFDEGSLSNVIARDKK